MTERSSQPLNPAVLSAAFEQRCENLTSFLGRFQGLRLTEDRDLLIQQLGMIPLGLLGGYDNRIVQRTVPSTIPNKYTSKTIFAKLVVRNTLDNLISDLENQLINSEEDNGGIRGLLSYSDATSLERNGQDVLPFCESAIKEYLSQYKGKGHGDGPDGSTEHVIMLPRKEKPNLTDQKELGGLRILSSDFLSEGHGLIFAPSDFQLLVDSHLEWEIDRERVRYPIIVRYYAGLAARLAEPLVLRVNY